MADNVMIYYINMIEYLSILETIVEETILKIY